MARVGGTVYLIDDDNSMRDSLARMLRDVGYVIQDFESATSFLQNSLPVAPAMILLDMQMPDVSGLELMERLEKLGRKTPIVFLSGQSYPQEIVKGLKKGALDFLFKPFNIDELLQAIDQAIEFDQRQLKKNLKEREVKRNFSSLTPREREVCGLLVEGLMNKEIAERLGTTDATIKVHKARVIEKMQANSVQELVKFYLEFNLANG
jgi:RNA polymerase sigma factor (sigma-70 family)